MKKITDLLSVIFFLIPCMFVIFMPKLISSLIKNALAVCASEIIPALFPFVVISQLLARSGAGENTGRLFSSVLSPLLGIRNNLCGVFLSGLLSGFPNGALSAGIAYSDGKCTKSDAEKVIALSNNCSFSFVCIVAGINALGSIKNGIILFTAQLLTTVITAQILRLYSNNTRENIVLVNKNIKSGISSVITRSITDSCINMLYICGYITVFNIISGIICNFLPKYYTAHFIVKAFSEVSGAVALAELSAFPLNLILCSVCIGFSGLSVIFQVCDVCLRYGLSPKLFILSRLYSAFLMPVITTILMIFLPREAMSVFGTSSVETTNTSSKLFYVILPVIAIILLLLLSLISTVNKHIGQKILKK